MANTNGPFMSSCNYGGCGWDSGVQINKTLSVAHYLWHVFDDHHAIWVSIYGNEPPIIGRPTEFLVYDMLRRLN